MKAVSLYSGFGGLDIGAEEAGIEVILQVEIDDYCRRVLAKHWPDARRIADVRDVTADDCRGADMLFGGFPCQDVSVAGKRAGLAGERSGLWFEFARLIREVRPRYVVVENVPGLFTAGMGTVLGDLSEMGLDAEWSLVSACSVGATHMRQRLFIVAHSPELVGLSRIWDPVARQGWEVQEEHRAAHTRACAKARMADPSALYRGADVVPNRLDRNHGLGNAVFPPQGSFVFRRVMEAERL